MIIARVSLENFIAANIMHQQNFACLLAAMMCVSLYLFFKPPGQHSIYFIQDKYFDTPGVESVAGYHMLHTTRSS